MCLWLIIVCKVSQAEEPVYELNIPATNVAEALNLFAEQTGAITLFPYELASTKQSHGLRGRYELLEGLDLLLKDTGLSGGLFATRVVRISLAESGPVDNRTADEDQDMPAKKATFGNRITAVVASLFTATSASGQGPNADDPVLEEIIVTAQKREQNLQEVPISIQVVTRQVIAENNYNSLPDLTRNVPGVFIVPNQLSPSIYIRGIGNNLTGNLLDQAVGTFVDDVYRGRSILTTAAFLDLERVEFLKGPQTTFFGNSSIAGAMSLTTMKPGDKLETMFRALYGSYDRYAVEGAIGGPLSETFGIRVAATWNGIDDGWIKNVNTGQTLPNYYNLAGRITLAYNPSDELDVTLKLENGRSESTGSSFAQPRQIAYCPPPPPLAANALYRECPTALAEGVPIGLDTNEIAALDGQGGELETLESVLTINYQKWGHVFTSVTAYNDYDSSLKDDDANVISWVNSNTVLESADQFSQEFRLTSEDGDRFEYLAGIYYQTNHIDSTLETAAPFTNPFFIGNPNLAPFLPWAFQQVAIQDEEMFSIFGSIGWHITDQFKLNVGLRGTSIEKDRLGILHYGTATDIFDGFVLGPPDFEAATALIGPPGETPRLYEDEAWTPTVSMQYHFDSASMAYASYTKGYKAGGAVNDVSTFGPELANAYEVGLKAIWFDNRLLFNINLFLSDYDDLQVQTFVFQPATGTYLSDFRNAANSRSQGSELETELVIGGFRLGANITYLDADYVSYPNANVTPFQRLSGLPVQDLSGRPLDFAPEWNGSVIASYSRTLANDYQATFEVSTYFSSSFYSSFGTLSPVTEISGYGRIDARLSLGSIGDHWTVDLIGKNLTDRLIPIEISVEGFARKEEPRNVAVQFRYAF